MRCPNISGRVQSGLTSTNSCTAACDAKLFVSVTLGCFLCDLIYAPLITTYKETKKNDIGLCPTKFNP